MAEIVEEALALPQEFKQGELTPQGVEVEGEVVIQRQKGKKHGDLTIEQNYTLERWTKEALRDYPNMDPWWAESIAYYCLVKPEEAEEYASANASKIFQTFNDANECWKKIEEGNSNAKRDMPFVDFNMFKTDVKDIEAPEYKLNVITEN